MNLFSQAERVSIQLPVPFSNLPQSPINRFLHEVPIVDCTLQNQREKLQKNCIGSFLVMNGKYRHQNVPGTFHKFVGTAAPEPGFLRGERSLVEKNTAAGITHGPIIKIPSPTVHLSACDKSRVFYECGENARLEIPGAPQTLGKLVILTDLFCEGAEGYGSNAEYLAAGDAESCHALNVVPCAKRFQSAQQGGR